MAYPPHTMGLIALQAFLIEDDDPIDNFIAMAARDHKLKTPATKSHNGLSSALSGKKEEMLLLEVAAREDNYLEDNILPHYTDLQFKLHFRMERTSVEELIHLISPHLQMKARIITVEKKILSFLWLLGNQESFRGVAHRFGLGKGSLYRIFFEVCYALREIRNTFISWPHSLTEKEHIAEDFVRKTGFPCVVGAIDVTHIPIPRPENRADYINPKGFPSIILQAVCDANMQFLDVFAGYGGSTHDADVFRNSPLKSLLDADNIPEDYHLLGDSAYSLSMNMMVPFRNNGHLTAVERAYNEIHSSTRMVVEKAFGLLKSKWRRLKYLNMAKVEDVPCVILAACTLHNFMLITEKLVWEGEMENEDEDEIIINVDNDDFTEPRRNENRAQMKRTDLANRIY